MAKRNSGRGSRARKRRRRAAPAHALSGPGAPEASHEEREPAPDAGGTARRRAPQQASSRRGRGAGSQQAPHEIGAVGERPQSPWHPLPLSELVILVGAIGAVVAWRRGPEHNAALLIAGVAAVTIGTIEVTLREHLSGYRSHTTLLAALPTIVLHTGVTLLVLAVATAPRWLFLALLPVDAAFFSVLFRVLRARFTDARRERVFALRGR